MNDFMGVSDHDDVMGIMMERLELDRSIFESHESMKDTHKENPEEFYSKMSGMTGLSEDFFRYLDNPPAAGEQKNFSIGVPDELGNARNLSIVSDVQMENYTIIAPQINIFIEQERSRCADCGDIQAELDMRGLLEPFGLGGLWDRLEENNRHFEELYEQLMEQFQETLSPPETSELPEIPDGQIAPEGIHEFKETDDFSEQTLAVLEQVLTLEIAMNWEYMTLDQRAEVLDVIATRVGEATGVDILGVYVTDLGGALGVNDGSGYQGIDTRHLMEDSMESSMDTLLHEMRHEYQRAVIANPENFPEVPSETVAEWAANMPPAGYYISDCDDFYGYWNQPIEVDAREWAESKIEIHVDKLVEELRGVAKQ
jgi:hypothetical protein